MADIKHSAKHPLNLRGWPIEEAIEELESCAFGIQHARHYALKANLLKEARWLRHYCFCVEQLTEILDKDLISEEMKKRIQRILEWKEYYGSSSKSRSK